MGILNVMCRDSLSLFYPLKVPALKKVLCFLHFLFFFVVLSFLALLSFSLLCMFVFLFRGFIISYFTLFLFALNVSVSSWGLAVLSFSCRFSGVKPVGIAKFFSAVL